MDVFAIRLNPGNDLKQGLGEFVQAQQIQAGFILSAIGSLTQAKLRLADQPVSTVFHQRFEILALNGTLSMDGMHLHMAIANTQGSVIGGHVDQGCLIYTTAEIVIGTSSALQFTREFDPQTGFHELKINPKL